MRQRGLGKGLGALFEEPVETIRSENELTSIKITSIEPNRNQPRKTFDEEQMQALTQSICEHGVIQPIVVTKLENGFYRIIAGERRWRAARSAGLNEIPALVRDYSTQQQMEIALIENIQRQDLDPIEEAHGIKALMDEFNLTQEQIAQRVSRSRSSIANTLRLLNLPDKVTNMLRDKSLTIGHAKLLLSLPTAQLQEQVAQEVCDLGLSVKQTEKLCKSVLKPKPTVVEKTDQVHFREYESRLTSQLGTRVSIKESKGKGSIQIEYYSNDDLNRVIDIILQNNNHSNLP